MPEQRLTELHLHFHGCVRPPDLLRHLAASEDTDWDWYEGEMAAAYGAVPPTRRVVERHRRGDPGAAAEFARLFVFRDEDAGSFARFQAKANLLFAAPADPAVFAPGIRADLARQGLAHAELRVSAAMFPALAATSGNTPVAERFAVSLPRRDPWPDWERVRALALGPHGHLLTGIDFSGAEEGHPPRAQAAFLAAVHEFNATHPRRALAILYHVGESFGDKSLESAVRWVHEAAELGAHRLGHAIALGLDPHTLGPHTREEPASERRDQIAYDLEHAKGLGEFGVVVDPAALRAELARLAPLPEAAPVPARYDAARLTDVARRQRYATSRLRALGTVIEVCPTSNRRTAGLTDPAAHPLGQFLAAGLPVTISSDDPGLFGTTLAEELAWAAENFPGGQALRPHLLATAWSSRAEILTGRAQVP
ncbi:hypothetical protein RM780_15900 [Streptomyces sp. DSM 44917]|uniref:adenosine deaminase n=1 Tax=Streptomyces boetiae TaxID=3075541 RepID=A0ABU2LA38_9ACTN|nr:hypothetical protein [Streptomyces sp. DSM 44917]MDT0308433.1 hypothetical protein [Streptomyces sp. DSM 44917]